jgi:hypothetical protein
MTLKSTKLAQPTSRTHNEEPDPVGFGTPLAEMIAELKDAYHARLHAFLRVFLLVRLAPAVLQSILDAATAQGGPVSFDLTITVHPRSASGFFRVVGALKPPSDELSDEPLPDEPEYYVHSIFSDVPVRVGPPKRGRRRFGRRR